MQPDTIETIAVIGLFVAIVASWALIAYLFDKRFRSVSADFASIARDLSQQADEIRKQLQRMVEERNSTQAWFSSTDERVTAAQRDAREALLKGAQLEGQVVSLESRFATHVYREHGNSMHKPGGPEDA
jgi:predicted Holliday junction resolvase-like endonuclease